jgi:hypothetical protein
MVVMMRYAFDLGCTQQLLKVFSDRVISLT